MRIQDAEENSGEKTQSTEFDLLSGNVRISTPHPVTFDGLADLARVGRLLGVPADAHVSSVQMVRRADGTISAHQIWLSWECVKR